MNVNGNRRVSYAIRKMVSTDIMFKARAKIKKASVTHAWSIVLLTPSTNEANTL